MSFWFKIVFYSDSSKILTFYFALIKLLFPPYQAERLWDIEWDTLNLRNIIHRVKPTKFQKQYTCWTYQICWVTNSPPHLKIKTDVSLIPMSLTLVSFTQPNFIKFIKVEKDFEFPVRDDLKKKLMEFSIKTLTHSPSPLTNHLSGISKWGGSGKKQVCFKAFQEK